MPTYVRFSPEQLKRVRQHAGLSRTKLAASLDVSAETVAAWEQGWRTPRAHSVGSLAHVLSCTMEALFAPVNDDDPAGRPGRRGIASGRTHVRT